MALGEDRERMIDALARLVEAMESGLEAWRRNSERACAAGMKSL
ncbi:hypothetical protein [Streptomyces sp. NPDC050704]